LLLEWSIVNFFKPARLGKETIMKRLVFSLLMLGLVAASIVGCRAEGEVGKTSTSVGTAR
jgi:hypothetical protein